MNDHIRVSDADRERVADRLREHFAEGRLSSDELDERIAATLSAKTFAELRRVTADLPEPEPAQAQGQGQGRGRPYPPPWVGRRGFAMRRRGPRLLPLVLLLLIAALVIPGAGWLLVAFVKVVLVFWLVATVAAIFAAARFRRHVRRQRQSGPRGPWSQWQ
jgi:Flp pilus assembly protein TadB